MQGIVRVQLRIAEWGHSCHGKGRAPPSAEWIPIGPDCSDERAAMVARDGEAEEKVEVETARMKLE